ncbi:uncharacterized protein A4U43_C10F18790 [Asparagus officinalis]|uniref:Uncharacterized protein n=1 Tax=Asparagus officinalis TaxID=4686 RepID=A0A5P1E5Q5_ASPOF|nr:late embryogenesis abundant protein 7-like [Asparagus officinalis]ONK57313.1 uncharacterized protein A4U43_C10F18790 [Asparagus officinalis]
MSNPQQQFSAGQARGVGVAQADKWVGSETNSLQAHRSDAAQSVEETKEQAAGLLQQTGEQVKQMARGAVETVKNTLGVGDHNNSSRS